MEPQQTSKNDWVWQLVIICVIGFLVWQFVSKKQADGVPKPQPKPQPTISPQPIEPTPTPTDNTVGQIEWLSWAEGQKQANETGKPAFIHFTGGKWCNPCENLRRNVFTNQAVVNASKEFVCIKFDCEDDAAKDNKETKAAMQAFGVDRIKEGVPQNVFVSPKWLRPFCVVTGPMMPTDSVGFVDYFKSWQTKFKDDTK